MLHTGCQIKNNSRNVMYNYIREQIRVVNVIKFFSRYNQTIKIHATLINMFGITSL